MAFFGPPHALTVRLPRIMPKPATESTAPRTWTEAKDSTKGVLKITTMPSRKLVTAKKIRSAIKAGRL